MSLVFLTLTHLILATSLVKSDQVYNLTNEVKLEKFNWDDCGPPDGPIKVETLSVGPDPIVVPGMVSIGFTGYSKVNVTSPRPFSVKMHKKVGWIWLPVPCEGNLGSCDYADFCTFWPLPKPCPEAYKRNNIPCECPFLARKYSFPYTSVMPLKRDFPKFLESGTFKVKATITNQKEETEACIDLMFSVKAVKLRSLP